MDPLSLDHQSLSAPNALKGQSARRRPLGPSVPPASVSPDWTGAAPNQRRPRLQIPVSSSARARPALGPDRLDQSEGSQAAMTSPARWASQGKGNRFLINQRCDNDNERALPQVAAEGFWGLRRMSWRLLIRACQLVFQRKIFGVVSLIAG